MSLLSVPLKTVLLYHADLQNETIPESYEVCDGRLLNSNEQDINIGGTYQLPDLRNRFILGADITKSAGTTGSTGSSATDAPGPKGASGANAHTLTTTELPAHSHSASTVSNGAHTHSGSSTDAGGSHVHTASALSAGSHTHAGSSMSTAGAHVHGTSSMSTAGAHVHGILDPGHLHNFRFQNISNLVTGSAGSGQQSAQYIFFPRDEPDYRTDLIGVSITGISLATNGDHTHTLNISSDGGHQHTLTLASDGSHDHTITVNSGGSHTHNITLVSDGAHTHTVNVNNTGDGTAIDMRPRFYGIVYIMKVRK